VLPTVAAAPLDLRNLTYSHAVVSAWGSRTSSRSFTQRRYLRTAFALPIAVVDDLVPMTEATISLASSI